MGLRTAGSLLLVALTGVRAAGNVSSGAAAYACQPGCASAALPFCDPSLDVEVRVADLVKRISNTDKPLLLTAREEASAPIAGDVIPSYYW